jgi:hypothetical protein
LLLSTASGNPSWIVGTAVRALRSPTQPMPKKSRSLTGLCWTG